MIAGPPAFYHRTLGLGCLMAWLPAVFAQAACLRVDQVDAGDFPQMAVYATVLDQAENPVMDLKEEAWEALVDGVPLRGARQVMPFQFSQQKMALAVILAASGIMHGRPLESEKAAVGKLSSSLRPGDKLAVLVYGDHVETLAGFEGKPEELRPRLNKMQTMGDTVMLYDALWHGLEVLSPKDPAALPVRRGILIISDGRDNGSTRTREEVMARIKNANIPVYGVGFTLLSDKYLPALRSLAEASGGAYWNAPGEEAISRCLEKISVQMQKGQMVVFRVKGKQVPADGQSHQLTLKVKSGPQTLAATKGFTAIRKPRSLGEKIAGVVLWVLLALLVAGVMLWYFLYPIAGYKRKCPKCRRIMKDEWEECLFCKYAPCYSVKLLKTKH